MTNMYQGKQYSFDAGRSELVVFDQDDGVSITVQSKARGAHDYHMQQASGSLSPEVIQELVQRLSPDIAGMIKVPTEVWDSVLADLQAHVSPDRFQAIQMAVLS